MTTLDWKKISSKYLVRAPWATLRVDTCKMQDGTIIPEYYVLEYPNWVNVIALTEDNQVILVRQYRHAAGEVLLEIPGGVIEKDESPEQAARRELLEETGYEFASFESLAELYANPSTANNKTYCYLATGGIKTSGQQLDHGEELIVELVSLDELKELVLSNKLGQALHTSNVFYGLVKLGLLK